MDLTCLLPCEIIQMIASGLLPRYQCRLALTSRQNYDCLYSPLLRWHAKRALIPIPRCVYKTLPNGTVSIIEIGKLVVYDSNEYGDELFVDNFTNKKSLMIDNDCKCIEKNPNNSIYELWCLVGHHEENVNILDGFCRYMHKDILLAYVMIRNPLLGLPYYVRDRLMFYLPLGSIKAITETTPFAKWVF